MARSMGIPAIVGAGEKADEIEDGDLLLIDGAMGECRRRPMRKRFPALRRRKRPRRSIVQCWCSLRIRGATSDGRRVIIEGAHRCTG